MFIEVPNITGVQFQVKDISFEMMEVTGGSFMMGSEEYYEKPIHEVAVNDFLLGKYPVTQALWEAVMGNNQSEFKGDNRPVEEVSWYDAVAFCNALSELLGKVKVYKGSRETIEIDYTANGFRLPTEAEWEYAARGGKQQEGYTYAGGNDPHLIGWYDENRHHETKPVGLKQPNALGLYDMSGNVWEWCNDWYGEKYYEESLSSNPKGPKTGSFRVLRGCSWIFHPHFLRVSNRSSYHPVDRGSSVGFRLCLSQF